MGLPLKISWKLQLVQNAVACTFMGAPRFTYLKLLLHELHWLSISFWMQFKVLIIIFKVLYGTEPSYLGNSLFKRTSAHSARLWVCSLSPIPCHLGASTCAFTSLGGSPYGTPFPWNAVGLNLPSLPTLKIWLFPKCIGWSDCISNLTWCQVLVFYGFHSFNIVFNVLLLILF